MTTKQVELVDNVLDWFEDRRRVELGTFARNHDTSPFVKSQLRQLRVDRDAQLSVIVAAKTCGCGRCGR